MKENLVLPNDFVELNQEEMLYTDGGWSYYFSNADVKNFVSNAYGGYQQANTALIIGGVGSIAGIAVGLVKQILAFSGMGLIPVFGQIALAILAAVAVASAIVVGTAFLSNKGIKLFADASISWFSLKVSAGIQIV